MRIQPVSLALLALVAFTSAAQLPRSPRFAPAHDVNDDLDPNLALGRTLLQSARRMYPDAPKVFDGRSHYSINEGNPQLIDRDKMEWAIGGVTLLPKYAFQTGGRWTLYFDANERLISATRGAGRQAESREALARRYPTLKLTHDGQNYQSFEVTLEPCHVLEIIVMKEHWQTSSYSHAFTCPTGQKP